MSAYLSHKDSLNPFSERQIDRISSLSLIHIFPKRGLCGDSADRACVKSYADDPDGASAGRIRAGGGNLPDRGSDSHGHQLRGRSGGVGLHFPDAGRVGPRCV